LLTSLTYLNVSGTAIKELPKSIGGCTALQKLFLRDCDALTSLGDGIGGCTALQTLLLYDCESLASLGDGTLRCPDGQNLFVGPHGFILNPKWTEDNADEEYKYINQIGEEQDEEPDQLLPPETCFKTCLHCNLHKDAHQYDTSGGLWQLDIKTLSLHGCKKLDMASTVDLIVLHFKNIEQLYIGDTDIPVLTEGVGNCTALQTLDCSRCFKLESLPPSDHTLQV